MEHALRMEKNTRHWHGTSAGKALKFTWRESNAPILMLLELIHIFYDPRAFIHEPIHQGFDGMSFYFLLKHRELGKFITFYIVDLSSILLHVISYRVIFLSCKCNSMQSIYYTMNNLWGFLILSVKRNFPRVHLVLCGWMICVDKFIMRFICSLVH